MKIEKEREREINICLVTVPDERLGDYMRDRIAKADENILHT